MIPTAAAGCGGPILIGKATGSRFAHRRQNATRGMKAARVVPIFPELAPLLDERFAEAEEGDQYVLR